MYRSESKILTEGPEIDRRIAYWRFKGQRVVMTNGCFDLLHLGHADYLERARALGDVLVVAVNSDESVRRLKGPSRPIMPETARYRLLAALEAVDAVLPFAADDPLELIRRVRPAVLVKGADYTPEQVIGAAELPQWGGRLELLDLVPGFSTTDLVARIRQLD
jgi:D-beta-D-heptose 7-phosphate kinase/D-beta-D-heptose 1-phosphate adenosyltransferase